MYLVILNKIVFRAEKEYSQRVGNLTAQKKKLDETFEKKQEEVTARSSDLNQQLQNMKEKFKVLFTFILLNRLFYLIS